MNQSDSCYAPGFGPTGMWRDWQRLRILGLGWNPAPNSEGGEGFFAGEVQRRGGPLNHGTPQSSQAGQTTIADDRFAEKSRDTGPPPP